MEYCSQYNLSKQDVFKLSAQYNSLCQKGPLQVKLLYKQSHLLNTKHPVAQEAIVKAAGADLKTGLILWPQYLHMYALLGYQNAPVQAQQDFWLRVINPKGEEYIPAENFSQIIDCLKKQMGTTDDLMSGDFVERLWQKLKQLDTVQPSGLHKGCIIRDKLKMVLKVGQISIKVFSQLVSAECSFMLQF